MFVINDIELLERLIKHGVFGILTEHCNFSISGIRLNDYSFKVRNEIAVQTKVSVKNINKEDFDSWIAGKRKYLTISDLSSIYVALCNNGSVLLLSNEDEFLLNMAKKCGVAYLQFDDFFISMVKDKKTIQLYDLIKVA